MNWPSIGHLDGHYQEHLAASAAINVGAPSARAWRPAKWARQEASKLDGLMLSAGDWPAPAPVQFGSIGTCFVFHYHSIEWRNWRRAHWPTGARARARARPARGRMLHKRPFDRRVTLSTVAMILYAGGFYLPSTALEARTGRLMGHSKVNI